MFTLFSQFRDSSPKETFTQVIPIWKTNGEICKTTMHKLIGMEALKKIDTKALGKNYRCGFYDKETNSTEMEVSTLQLNG